MMEGNEFLLAFGACTHTLGASQQDTHLTYAHLAEQIFLLRFALGVMDVCDLVFGNAQLQQLGANIIVDAEASITLGRGQIAENHLRGTSVCGALPDLEYIFHTLGGFAVRITGQHGVDEPLIQRQLTAIVGDQQHIHLAVADFLRPLCQRRYRRDSSAFQYQKNHAYCL